MKKFKDFLYDKNDILIAVLILVVAAAIIAWRMDVILQYPKQLIHNDSQIETPPVDPSKTEIICPDIGQKSVHPPYAREKSGKEENA